MRVSAAEPKPGRIDDVVRYYDQRIGGAYQSCAGFCGAYLLVDRSAGLVQSVSMWESRRHLQDSIAAEGYQKAASGTSTTPHAFFLFFCGRVAVLVAALFDLRSCISACFSPAFRGHLAESAPGQTGLIQLLVAPPMLNDAQTLELAVSVPKSALADDPE